MSNATDGARIKVWPGAPAALSGDLQGGGGSGSVKNIKYQNCECSFGRKTAVDALTVSLDAITNVDYAIEVTQCYGQSNLTLCNEFPSNLTISDVTMTNITGTTSKTFDPISGYIVCSSRKVCSNIKVSDIHVVAPSGTVNEFTCGDVKKSLLHGINCTTENKGGN